MALEASAELHRMLDSFVAATELLQDHVVAKDGLGELGESLDELVLRARASVLVAQIGRLRGPFREPAVQARTRGWFVGQCRDIDDLDTFIQERVAKVHSLWTPYRQDGPQPAGMTESDRGSLYRTAARVAQRALCALRPEPELSRFIDCGVEATDLFEINVACKQIDAVLRLQIDGESCRHPLRKPRRIVATNGAYEER
jgi:hypothetical protein